MDRTLDLTVKVISGIFFCSLSIYGLIKGNLVYIALGNIGILILTTSKK